MCGIREAQKHCYLFVYLMRAMPINEHSITLYKYAGFSWKLFSIRLHCLGDGMSLFSFCVNFKYSYNRKLLSD